MRKLIKSLRYLTSFLMILIFSVPLFAQFEKYSVPAKWELYSVTDKKVSFLMPRLPVRYEQEYLDYCDDTEAESFAAYSDGVVYQVRIISKLKSKVTGQDDFCSKVREFNENKFTGRIKYISGNLNKPGEYENNSKGQEIFKYANDVHEAKFINDYQNKRWFEIYTYGANEKKSEVKNFLASFKWENAPNGIVIGQGAEQQYGDDVADEFVEKIITNDEGVKQKIKELIVKTDSKRRDQSVSIIAKPYALYTNEARKAGVQGKVVLRVTFMANGAIGDISVVEGLEKGLTEQAIQAARKIAFLPGEQEGARRSVIRTEDYYFSIY